MAYVTATAAWPYSRTFLSEPLSALVLLLAALAIARAHARRGEGGERQLWLAGAAAGFSVHVHVLNVVAWPCLLAYALAPAWREGHVRRDGFLRACLRELVGRRRGYVGAALLAGLGLGSLLLGQWLRFGDPLETGRFGHYSEWTNPWTGLWAQMVAPGRSFWLYSPAAALGLVGARAAWRRAPEATGLALALLVTRWAVVSGRSDWFGGWGIGARHLVPVIPFVMIGFAAAVEELPRWSATRRRLFWAGLAAGVLLTAHLATHSIFEWLFRLMADPRLDGRSYLEVSHFSPWASPIAGFFSLEPDVLALGAIRLAKLGHPGLLVGFVVVAIVGIVGAAIVGRVLLRGRG